MEHTGIVNLAQLLTSSIVQADVQGEPVTGFEKRGAKGKFECGNCSYFDGSSCGQSVMMAQSKQPRNTKGRPQVGKHDCCEYVDRVGKK